MVGCTYVDGVFSAPEDARIKVCDHGFLYGDGVFESIRTYRGKPFLLTEHLERLERSLKLLEFPNIPTQQHIRGVVEEVLRRAELQDVYLRITVARGRGVKGVDPAGCTQPTLVCAALPLRAYPETCYERGVPVGTLWPRHSRSMPPPTVKTASYQGAICGRLAIAKMNVQDGLYLDEHGNITESTVANIFVVKKGQLSTPPAHVCLPGITRAAILRIAQDMSLPFIEEPLRPDVLANADEAFLSNSLAEILPIISYDDRTIGAGAPGPVTRSLHAAYRRLTAAL